MTIKSIFYPGKAVTADFLNESQFFGPANLGISFVPNPIDFWQYPLLTTASFDVADFATLFVLKAGNVTIDGTKTFTTTPLFPTGGPGDNSTKGATTAFVQQEIGLAITAGGFMDLTTTQTVIGFKTFQNIAVPVTPSFPNSPVSLQYAEATYVDKTSNENISGIKIFGNGPEVPVPTTSPQATPKGYVDGLIAGVTSTFNGLISALTTTVNGLQSAVATIQAVVTGLTFGGGTSTLGGYTFKYIVFPNNLKFIWASGVGGGGSAASVNFPSIAEGFPGFAAAPVVFLTGERNQGDCYAPQAISITSASFVRRNEVFGNNTVGGPTAFLAIGV